jgi:hypothetical protein
LRHIKIGEPNMNCAGIPLNPTYYIRKGSKPDSSLSDGASRDAMHYRSESANPKSLRGRFQPLGLQAGGRNLKSKIMTVTSYEHIG